jgi:hypothetical protein
MLRRSELPSTFSSRTPLSCSTTDSISVHLQDIHSSRGISRVARAALHGISAWHDYAVSAEELEIATVSTAPGLVRPLQDVWEPTGPYPFTSKHFEQAPGPSIVYCCTCLRCEAANTTSAQACCLAQHFSVSCSLGAHHALAWSYWLLELCDFCCSAAASSSRLTCTGGNARQAAPCHGRHDPTLLHTHHAMPGISITSLSS